MMYPLFIDLEGKEVLVVGGGKVGARRAKALISAGAKVTVVSKSFNKELEVLRVNLILGDVGETLPDLRNFFLVIIASDDPEVNEYVSSKAFEEGVLVNRADGKGKGDVIFPLTARVEGHILAYTTLGENPRLLKKIKKLIEDEFSRDEVKKA